MENVSDEMLRQKLMEKGMKLGPITSTTRALYQKMYLEHLEDGKLLFVCFCMVFVCFSFVCSVKFDRVIHSIKVLMPMIG